MKNKGFMWLCVDSNGDEKMSTNPGGLQRFYPSRYHDNSYSTDEAYELHRIERRKVISFDDTQMKYDHWVEYHDPDSVSKCGIAPEWQYLVKGTIRLLIGRELTWEDEPVKLESYD